MSDGVSQKVLSQQLCELMADGIVKRERTGAIPAPVIYSLTAYGNAALPMMDTIRRWGIGHIERTRTTAPGMPRELLNFAVTH